MTVETRVVVGEPYFIVDGTVYSSYTGEPAKAINVEDAATMSGVTVRTMRKWIKKAIRHQNLRHVMDGKTILLIDYDVQYWLENIINQSKPMRTWKRAIANLKNLLLINRQTVLEKLQARHDQKWTPLQMRVNSFDESHIAAYQRGLADAIRIVQCAGVESFDYQPLVGQHINVGGCVGEIRKITDHSIIVSGVYGYTGIGDEDSGDRGFYEAWRFAYALEDVMNADIRPWWGLKIALKDSKRPIVWDYEDLPHK